MKDKIDGLFGIPVHFSPGIPKDKMALFINGELKLIIDMAEIYNNKLSVFSTAELIADLERRRPCKRCEHWQHNATPCLSCFWKGLWNMGEALHKDNFKEAA